jgi:hypothetical protein
MKKAAQPVRSTTTPSRRPESDPARQPSARQAPSPGLANNTLQRLQATLSKKRDYNQLWFSDQAKERKVAEEKKILEKQQATYEVLIERFGPKVGLSLDLHNYVVDNMASPAEIAEYQAKMEAMIKLVHKFYREFDVAKIDSVDDRDLNVLIAMLSTGFAVTQSQTTQITKVLNNKSLTSRMAGAIANNAVSITGFIGSSEATAALSPQQQVTTLGLDYEYQNRTDFLLQTGEEGGKPTYVPIPQTTYIKIPYTNQLKNLTQMTLDVRFYEKILERAGRTAKADGDFFTFTDEVITEMAKEISSRPVSLKYKISKNEAPEEAAAKSAEFSKKYKDHGAVKAEMPPFTGLGFSAYGEKISSGFMNMYPEMNINVGINQDNFKTLLGEQGRMEFYTKFAKAEPRLKGRESSGSTQWGKGKPGLNIPKPSGSTDVLMAHWNGGEMTIPLESQKQYDENLKRVKSTFKGKKGRENAALLEKNKFSHSEVAVSVQKIKDNLAEAKKKLEAESGKLTALKQP